MKYYIVTSDVFNTLNKENIQFMLRSIDKSKNIVVTSDTIDSVLHSFTKASELSSYTFDNNSEWVGDGTGVTTDEINTVEYVSELDD
jgi:hypothetical protein|tara:strand:- start:28 stop:288 length:261 start_codon:yes stop_codon:yes gene_type:complete